MAAILSRPQCVKRPNVPVSPLQETHNHQRAMSLMGLTVSWSPSFAHTSIRRPFHGLDCFSLSPACILIYAAKGILAFNVAPVFPDLNEFIKQGVL